MLQILIEVYVTEVEMISSGMQYFQAYARLTNLYIEIMVILIQAVKGSVYLESDISFVKKKKIQEIVLGLTHYMSLQSVP